MESRNVAAAVAAPILIEHSYGVLPESIASLCRAAIVCGRLIILPLTAVTVLAEGAQVAQPRCIPELCCAAIPSKGCLVIRSKPRAALLAGP